MPQLPRRGKRADSLPVACDSAQIMRSCCRYGQQGGNLNETLQALIPNFNVVAPQENTHRLVTVQVPEPIHE